MLRFKTPRIATEWVDERLSPALKAMVYTALGYLNDKYSVEELTLTSIFRTHEEQAAVSDKPGIHSAHEFWRGADVRVHGLPDGAADKVAEFLNNHYLYDQTRPNMRCAIVHGAGDNIHLHLQVYVSECGWRT